MFDDAVLRRRPRSGRRDQQRSGAGKTRAQRCRSPVFHQGPEHRTGGFLGARPGHDLEQALGSVLADSNSGVTAAQCRRPENNSFRSVADSVCDRGGTRVSPTSTMTLGILFGVRRGQNAASNSRAKPRLAQVCNFRSADRPGHVFSLLRAAGRAAFFLFFYGAANASRAGGSRGRGQRSAQRSPTSTSTWRTAATGSAHVVCALLA